MFLMIEMVQPCLMQTLEVINILCHAEPENITLEIKEGEPLNITCRARMRTESTSVMWLKDNRLIEKGRNRFLFIQSINKSQAGSYMCVSMSQFRDHSPSFTAVDVLCEYFEVCPTHRLLV